MESADSRVSSTEGRPREAHRFRTFFFLVWAVTGALIVAGFGGAVWRLGTNAYYAYRPNIEWNEVFEETAVATMMEEHQAALAASIAKADDPEAANTFALAASNRLSERLAEKMNSALRKERTRRLDAVFMWAVLVALAGAATLGWFFAGIRYRIWIDTSPSMPSRFPPGQRHIPKDDAEIPGDPAPADVIADLLKHR